MALPSKVGRYKCRAVQSLATKIQLPCAMQSLPVNDGGAEIGYYDSGPPFHGSPYTTLVIIHGYAFNAGMLFTSRLLTCADEMQQTSLEPWLEQGSMASAPCLLLGGITPARRRYLRKNGTSYEAPTRICIFNFYEREVMRSRDSLLRSSKRPRHLPSAQELKAGYLLSGGLWEPTY